MSRQTLGLGERLQDYVVQYGAREPDILARLRTETLELPLGIMQISPDQGAFLTLLVQLIGARTTLEVGVFTGYSSLAVALALPEDGQVVACDISEEWTSVARGYWREAGVEDKIDLRLAPALETLDGLLAEGRADTFDFAFIDADKQEYEDYFERVLKLLRPGGLAAIDNVLWSGKVADEAVEDDSTVALREFNRLRHEDQRINLCLLPIGDGVTLAQKRA
tara:strand:+ start:13754 stop:14419 length:666 start_codon:yes stop_codon:yes gene_type:complete